MFSGLTAKARKVIGEYAQEEAKRLNFDLLQPEHIFLGLIRETESVAVKVLEKAKLDTEKIRIQLENAIKKPSSTMVLGDLQPSERVQKILTLSTEEAKKLNHNFIGTEHLLLGIMQEEDGTVYNLLESENVTINLIRRLTVDMLGYGILPKSSGSRKIRKTPTLDAFGQDYTALAKDNKIDPVVGRKAEISRLIQILSRRTKNNPILIGEPGVGKSAIVEGLALRINERNIPDLLSDKRVVTLDIAACVAGTKYRGEFEERLKNIMMEVKKSNNVILFIDEIHTIIGAGGAEGAMDAANILKPALARGELQCVGSTTLKEYKRHFERDTALVRRFQPIQVDEPSVEDTIKILNGLKRRYEDYHHVNYNQECLSIAATMAKRYITERYLPDTAIDLIDEAGSRARLKNTNRPNYVKKIEEEINELTQKKNDVVKNQEFEQAAVIRDNIKIKKDALDRALSRWEREKKKHLLTITPEDITEIISSITNIPLIKLNSGESKRLLGMEKILHKRVIGQDEAVVAISKALRRSKAGLRSHKRPVGSFIFLGPTGVGKTELAKSLAEFMFGTEDSIIRVDMSEFMEKHTISRLIGSPPGYIGYEEGGDLTDKVRRKPYSVILLDEIEKAHPDIFNILLQVLEDGHLSDNLGHKVDFTNTIIILTSNLGSRQIVSETSLGFGGDDSVSDFKNIRTKALDELKNVFNPEFLNRIDDTIVFKPLEESDLIKILNILLVDLHDRLKEKDIKLKLSKAMRTHLIKKGYSRKYGARPLRRAMQTELEDILSEALLDKTLTRYCQAILDVKNGQPVLSSKKEAILPPQKKPVLSLKDKPTSDREVVLSSSKEIKLNSPPRNDLSLFEKTDTVSSRKAKPALSSSSKKKSSSSKKKTSSPLKKSKFPKSKHSKKE